MATSGASAVASSNGGYLRVLLRSGKASYRNRAIEFVAQIVDHVSVPVNADMETAYGDSVGEVAETTRRLIQAGAVGVNLEDSGASTNARPGPPLYAPTDQAQRIAAVRDAAEAAGVSLFINARTDVFLLSIGNEDRRLDDVIARATLYTQAGADGVFIPGLLDLVAIRTLKDAIAVPINVAVVPGAPGTSDLVTAGITRISPGNDRARALQTATLNRQDSPHRKPRSPIDRLSHQAHAR